LIKDILNVCQREAVIKMRIDIGCGKNKREDGIWIGIDLYPYPDVDIVSDVFEFLEEIENESISEANMSHFFEHLEVNERISIMNNHIPEDESRCSIAC
jgi:predicted SAM-dependent methyltransferase